MSRGAADSVAPGAQPGEDLIMSNKPRRGER
jgi:hypothetical protein